MGDRLSCTQEVVGSTPTRSIMVPEVEMEETLACEASY